MPTRIAKADLPRKICPVCARPFLWRKKWARCWSDVRYCSDACRRRRGRVEGEEGGRVKAEADPD